MPDTKILIVEDNPIVAHDIRNKLADRGYTSTVIATNAKQALDAAEAEVPDIALMDIHLGDKMIGIDTAMKLKQRHQLPVIYITAFADKDTVERAKVTEPYGYIVKPLNENELYSVLEIALYKLQSDRSTRESRSWLKTTLTCIGDGVIATDKNGRVVFMNAVAETLTKWRQSDAIGLPLEKVFKIVHEDTFTEIKNPIEKVLNEQQAVGLSEYTLLVAKDGQKIPITDSGAPIKGDRGEMIGVVLVFRDQTEERLARRSVDARLELIDYANNHSPDELLSKALEEVGYFVDSPVGFYHIVTDEQKYQPSEQRSNRTIYTFFKTADHGEHTSVEQTTRWEQFLAAKKPIINNDNPVYIPGQGFSPGSDDVTRELVVPVIREGKVVAIVGVGNKPTAYTQKDVEMVSYLADVTWGVISQKRAEQALRKSEERYRAVIEDTPVLICRFRPDGEITFVNNVYCDYFGTTAEKLIGSKFLSSIPEKDRIAVMDNIATLTRESPLLSHEHQVVAPNNDIRWQRWTNRALFNPQGTLVGYQSIGEDITKRKRAEEDLNRTILEWQTTFDAVNAAIWIIDKNHRIIRSNKNIERFFNKPHDELIGKACYEVLHDDRQPALQCPLPMARKSLHRETMEQKIGTGWFEVAVDPILDAEGRFAGAVHIVTDITKRKQSELDKEKLHAQLIQSQKMESVGRLAGGVAHDFNNMLSVIIGHAELALEETEVDSPLHQDLLEVLNAAHRSADLTRQLLAFARKQTAAPRVLDLNDTIESTLKMLRRLIGEDINLLWMPGTDLWPVKIDPAQIDQILANLCVNARDAIEGVGKISIETSNVDLDETYCADHPGFKPGEYGMLTVADNGHGIGEEIRDNIFEPFFTTKEAGRGTGLGLATVYGIVKQNNGFINVSSEPGQGATFSIFLPRIQKRVKQTEASVVNTDMRGTETVLLVEDEITILRLAERMLQNFGYTILSASSPAQAIGMARYHPDVIHLMITDVVMPEMNGQELKEKISSMIPKIKTLFMSGYTSDVISHHGILEDETNYLAKPFTVESLGSKVREVLGHGVRDD